MIKAKDLYEVASAIVPLYVAMIFGFGSVRWWKIFTPDHCSGVSRFVSHFAIPFLTFILVSANNPYTMNLKFIAADSLQKVVVFAALLTLSSFGLGSLDWNITLFSICTLPNTLIIGIPLLNRMYGEFTTTLMTQIVTLQLCVWVPFSLILFEFRAVKLSIQGRSATSEPNAQDIENPKPNPSNNAADVSDASIDAREVIIENEERDRISGSRSNMPAAGSMTIIVMTKLVLVMVWRKLYKNPNIWASVLGLVWSLLAFRFHIKLPEIVEGSITIFSNTGSGLAMFSLGMFVALQPKIMACGKKWTAMSMAIRYIGGPVVIAATSAAIGIRGDLLRVEIIQAALPQSILTFVFAEEYNLHPHIQSTAVALGMVIALPTTITYYVLL